MIIYIYIYTHKDKKKPGSQNILNISFTENFQIKIVEFPFI